MDENLVQNGQDNEINSENEECDVKEHGVIECTVKQLLDRGEETLKAAGIEDAHIDSRRLYAFLTGEQESMLFMSYSKEVPAETAKLYEELIMKRASGIPLQQITGVQNFMGLVFKVDENVLIPRRDTEVVTEEALKYINEAQSSGTLHVLDLCCGSGAIGISIAALSERNVDVLMLDISDKALKIARENIESLGVEDRVRAEKSDLFSYLRGNNDQSFKFDMIVSNPPYIKTAVIDTLDKEVKDHEPMLALDGGEDGLDIYRKLVPEATKYLKPGGLLIVEIGADQGETVPMLFSDAGFTDVTCGKDLAGLDRYVEGRLPL